MRDNGLMTESTDPAATDPETAAAEVVAAEAAAEAAATEPAAPQESATPAPAAPVVAEVSIRRAPKYSVFLVLGAALGAAAALVLTLAFPETPSYSQGQVFGFLVLIGVVVGVALGGFVAWLFDVASRRGTRTAEAERAELADADA